MGKFCTSCGTPLDEGAKFCALCGADSSQQNPTDMGKFISQYIRKSLEVLKNPKQMIPTIVLGLFWLVLALLGSFGINPLPVRILSFLTFAQGGMFGGVLGAVGGILGKVVVAAFLNAMIIPLFQKRLSGIGGIKAFQKPCCQV